MTSNDSPIFLIGYRGTGKTTVARELAAHLNYSATDTDDLIEQAAGKTIAQIFDDGGESTFRDLEVRVVADLCRRSKAVISLGGGAVLREENRLAIRDAGPIVWLTASVDTILERLAADPSTPGRRPNLTTAGGRDEIETLLKVRTPFFRECATLVVDTEGKSAAEVAVEILKQL